MPPIRRERIPEALMAHVIRRVRNGRFRQRSSVCSRAGWTLIPEVPEGEWFKRVPEMIVCGEGSRVKTFLRAGQALSG